MDSLSMRNTEQKRGFGLWPTFIILWCALILELFFVCNVTLKGQPVQICGWCVVTRVHGQTQPHLSGHILRVLKESLQRRDLVVLCSNKSCPTMSTWTLQRFPANIDRVSVSLHGYYCRLLHASGTSNHSGFKPTNQRCVSVCVWTSSTLP